MKGRSAWAVVAVAFVAAALLTPTAFAANWWDAGYGYRKPITFASNWATTNVSNFTLPLKITESIVGAGKHRADWLDLRFTASDNTTVLNYWINNYTATTAFVSVRVPMVNSSASNFIFMYYGNAGAANATDRANAYDQFYMVQYGMEELSGNVLDGSRMGVTGTPTAGVTTNSTQCVFGNCKQFASGTVDFTTSGIKSTNMTVSFWAYMNTAPAAQGDIFSFGASPWTQLYAEATPKFGVYQSGASAGVVMNIAVRSWYYFTAVFAGGSPIAVYSNGTLAGTTGTAQTVTTVGAALGGWGVGEYMAGNLDEVAAFNITRSADWINATFSAYAGTLATFGAEEAAAAGPVPIYLDGLSNIPYGVALTAYCYAPTAACTLLRNGTDVTAAENNTATTIGAGGWNYTAVAGSNSTQGWVVVNKLAYTFTLSPTTQTITYPTTVLERMLSNGTVAASRLTLWRNNTNITLMNGTSETISGGFQRFSANSTLPEANYSYTNQTSTVTVTKAQTAITLYLNGSAWTDDSIREYPNATNINATINTSGLQAAVVMQLNGSATNNPNATSLPIGAWNYTAYYAVTQNYTYSRAERFITITDTAGPSISVESPAGSMVFVGNKNASLNFTAADISGISKCWYSFDGGANTSLGSCANTTISVPAIGSHTLTVYANDTFGNKGNATQAFSADFLNEFRVYKHGEPGTLYDFTGVFTNSSGSSAFNNTAPDAVLRILTSALPWGSVTMNATGIGFNNTVYPIGLVNETAMLNLSFETWPALVEVLGAYDETTLLPVCYNLYAYNSTATYNASACGGLVVPYASMPQGFVTLTFTNATYSARNYYVTIGPTSYVPITAWLLPATQTVFITTFAYSDALPSGAAGVLVSAERFLNGSWMIVDQKISDTQGKGFFALYPYAQHRILASLGVLQAIIPTYYPNPTYWLYINLGGGSTGNVSTLFDSVSYSVTPAPGYIDNMTAIHYLISDSAGNLQNYYVQLWKVRGFAWSSLYNQTVTGAPSGGEIWINLNVTAYLVPNKTADYFVLLYGFKRSGFDNWNGSAVWLPLTGSPTYGGLPGAIATFTTGGFGIEPGFATNFIMIIIALFAGAAAATRDVFGNGSFYGTLIFIGVLGLFWLGGIAVGVPVVDTGLMVLMTLASIGIGLAVKP